MPGSKTSHRGPTNDSCSYKRNLKLGRVTKKVGRWYKTRLAWRDHRKRLILVILRMWNWINDNEEESITARRISLPSEFNQTKKVYWPCGFCELFVSKPHQRTLWIPWTGWEIKQLKQTLIYKQSYWLWKNAISILKGLSDLQGAHSKLLEKHESVTSTNRNLGNPACTFTR